MPTKRQGPRYTPEEAEALIPECVKRMTLTGVELMTLLDKYPVNSREIESRVISLTGYAGYLRRLCQVIWRYEGLNRAASSLESQKKKGRTAQRIK